MRQRKPGTNTQRFAMWVQSASRRSMSMKMCAARARRIVDSVMPRPSTIEQLPPDILEQLQELLRDPRVTQMEATARINAILADQGEEPVSKSAVIRYAVRMEQVGAKLRESRAVADMWF